MAILRASLTFIGVWLLYIFPLYQGVLEISEQDRIIGKFQQADNKYAPVSSWYWLLPPLKIKKEKERGIRILRENIHGQEEIHALTNFLNKAVAWFYIALAGILNGLVATYDLIDVLLKNQILLISVIVDIFNIVLGIMIVRRRMSSQHKKKIIQRIFKGKYDEKTPSSH